MKKLNLVFQRRFIAAAAIVVLSAAFFPAIQSLAFKPNEETFGHTYVTRSVTSATGYPVRKEVTNEKIDPFKVTLSDGRSIQFTDDAIGHLIQGVQSNDWLKGSFIDETQFKTMPDDSSWLTSEVDGVSFFSDLKDPDAHCDDDRLPECAELIVTRRVLAIEKLQRALIDLREDKHEDMRRDLVTARVLLGKAIHTVQDFYAHSNYANRMQGASGQIYSELTKEQNGKPTLTESPRTFIGDLCIPRYDYESRTERADGTYSYSFSWEKNRGNYQLSGSSSAPYTTGYFNFWEQGLGLDGSAPKAAVSGPTGTEVGGSRCDHGQDLLTAQIGSTQFSALHISGIAKDAPYFPFDPKPYGTNSPSLHWMAAYHAALHTKVFLEETIRKIKELPSPYDDEDKDIMIQLLLGEHPQVAFVLDTTGSMQDIIDGLATEMRELAQREIQNDEEQPFNAVDPKKKFLLVTYTESTSNVSKITPYPVGSASDVEARLKAIKANGGGDCKEPTLDAILATVRRVPPASKLYIFTDASSKPLSSNVDIAKLIKKKGLKVTFSVSGSCSPIDSSYVQLARASSSQLLLVDHTSDDVRAAMSDIAPGKRVFNPIHIEQGELGVGVSKTISIPVEAGVSHVVIRVTNDSGVVVVRDPAGTPQNATSFIGGSVLKIANPSAGMWSIDVAGFSTGGVSNYSVSAQAIGKFELQQVEYSSNLSNGRPGHEVNMPYGDNPPAAEVRVVSRLKSANPHNPQTYNWEAITEDGTSLGSMRVSRSTTDQYEGSADLRAISNSASRPWRVRVSGTDTEGKPFARVLPTLHNAKRYTIDVVEMPTYWLSGGDNVVRIRVDNYTASDSFSLNALATLGVVKSVRPAVMEVAPGDYGVFDVSVSIPNDTPVNVAHSLNISIVSRLAGNQIVESMKLPIRVEQDTDGDGVPDRLERGTLGKDLSYDGNQDGVPDWQQASVISLQSKQKRAYLTAALSSGSFRLARPLQADGAAQFKYPIDLLDFRVVNLVYGAQTQLKLILPGYMTAKGYGKYGIEPGNATPHWYDFNYDAVSQTGAVIDKNVVTLHLKDGGRGDDDLQANGVIVDPGGPTQVQLAEGSSQATSTVTGNALANPLSSTRGGGCTVGDPEQADASLLMLALWAMLGLAYRFYRQRRRHS